VSEETLALDVIAQAGPEGQYLNKDHTRRHYREVYSPDLFERQDHKTWHDAGATTLAQRAAQKVEEILAAHRPDPLPHDVRSELRRIVERAAVLGA
jgi:trimethylamine--corrinoid protein Co-methyltransferase